MQRRGRRTVIDLSSQPGLDFDDEAFEAEFILPRYQQKLLMPRVWALLIDMAIVFAMFLAFVLATMSEMAGGLILNRAVLGIYSAAYLTLVVTYLTLFMLSTSQTTGMCVQNLRVVNRHGHPLAPHEALLRSFGYLISTLPALFGFTWAFVDPEHLTWADKVSGTFVKRG
jgi:uncharacterized RDD family membrane protein YckC